MRKVGITLSPLSLCELGMEPSKANAPVLSMDFYTKKLQFRVLVQWVEEVGLKPETLSLGLCLSVSCIIL